MTTETEAVIARLEKATGPSVGLDVMIANAIGWMERVPNYTSSIDAALTLVPEGWVWAIEKNCAVVMKPGTEYIGDYLDYLCYSQACVGVSTAIALCIASLKARMKVRND